jgi:cytochrome c
LSRCVIDCGRLSRSLEAKPNDHAELLFIMRHLSIAAAILLPFICATGAAAQDAEKGENVFKACRACHQVGEGAKNGVGPVLNGIVGRKAGSIEGFNYSEANKEAGAGGLVWTEEKLFEYLEKPMVFMPKTKMAYAGLKDEGDRKDIIAFLKTQTAK